VTWLGRWLGQEVAAAAVAATATTMATGLPLHAGLITRLSSQQKL
jgi:hypothetical protein